MMFICRLVVQWLACLQLDPRFAVSHPAKSMDFKGNKNHDHAFLRRENKAVGPMS
jgi:hypothetical protein